MKHFNNRLKKFSLGITFLFAVFFTSLLIPLSSTAADSGTCGENIKWSLSSGVLELSGKGDMPAFSEDGLAPWYENRKNIRRVIIGDGITSIAPLSLYECENLHSLSLPATLTKIGDHAFYGCKRLVNVTIPSSVKIVEESAFRECEKLFYVSLPQGLEVLGDQAFYRCSTLCLRPLPWWRNWHFCVVKTLKQFIILVV